MRGKRHVGHAQVHDGRIIPARAGQTARPRAVWLWRAHHPRACGANCRCCNMFWTVSGSSPRVRGKLIGHLSFLLDKRIIPARAGQTPPNSPFRRFHPDHPRACGANAAKLALPSLPSGSSPRVRGKPTGERRQMAKLRIIPARAGQTCRPAPSSTASPDHPRACGANGVRHGRNQRGYGSSPRVRGKRRDAVLDFDDLRIIPARAGQTSSGFAPTGPRPDHPRACGANPMCPWT